MSSKSHQETMSAYDRQCERLKRIQFTIDPQTGKATYNNKDGDQEIHHLFHI